MEPNRTGLLLLSICMLSGTVYPQNQDHVGNHQASANHTSTSSIHKTHDPTNGNATTPSMPDHINHNHDSSTTTPSMMDHEHHDNHNAPPSHGTSHDHNRSDGSTKPSMMDHENHDNHNAPPSHDHSKPDDNTLITSDDTMDHDGHSKTDTEENGGHSGHGAPGLNQGGHYGFFHLTTKTVLLFEGWSTSTWQEILGACFAFGIATVFYEGLKALRQYLLVRSRQAYGFMTVEPSLRQRMFSCMNLVQSFLHIVQVVYSYMLMLAFMTFNGWICTAIALGAGIGYFIFSFDRRNIVDASEHCV